MLFISRAVMNSSRFTLQTTSTRKVDLKIAAALLAVLEEIEIYHQSLADFVGALIMKAGDGNSWSKSIEEHVRQKWKENSPPRKKTTKAPLAANA